VKVQDILVAANSEGCKMPIESRPGFRPPGFSPPQSPIPPAYTPPPVVVPSPPLAPTQTQPQMAEIPDNIVGYFMILLGL